MTAAGPAPAPVPALCRDCLAWREVRPGVRANCRSCGSPRLIAHPELRTLSLAHIDCDAFYASIEKRDDPSIADKPVIVGGGRRGVVSAACYLARTYGVRSAMPMFKALAACPDAVVVRPDMDKYAEVGRQVRTLMLETTPLVEPLSIDEAFLDLAGTERLHRGPPAETLARLALRIERELRITVSIGLSHNKFLAKISSDLDKPRGFGIVGVAETRDFLAAQPVSIIWGVGASLLRKLEADGVRTVGDLQRSEERDLMRRYGSMGQRLARFSRGLDSRRVEPGGAMKSVSAETTFEADLDLLDALRPILWRLSEKVSRRLKRKGIAGGTVALKLKTADFRILSRQSRLPDPTQLADVMYRTGLGLLEREIDGRRFRLIGIGVSDLSDPSRADPADLADPGRAKRREIEQAIDRVRAKLGTGAIGLGRGLRADGAAKPGRERR